MPETGGHLEPRARPGRGDRATILERHLVVTTVMDDQTGGPQARHDVVAVEFVPDVGTEPGLEHAAEFVGQAGRQRQRARSTHGVNHRAASGRRARRGWRRPRRFEDFTRDLGIARNVLTTRLASLVEHGVPVAIVHEDCGATTHAVTVCAACGQPMGPGDVLVDTRSNPSTWPAPR
ncbi:MAG: hypothetical protein WD378_03265 [Egicoccus sp.]